MKEKWKIWKKRLKRLWARRPRLGRGPRTVINLSIITVILLYVWGLAGYPLFFPTLEFRRMERQNLLPRGEIVFSVTPIVINNQYHGGRVGKQSDSAFQMTGTWRVSASENWVAAGYMDFNTLQGVYPRGEGADPVPLLETVITRNLRTCEPLLFLDMPEGTSPYLPDGPSRAEVEIGPFEYEGRTVRLMGEGMDLGRGVWLFPLDVDGINTRSVGWYAGAPYVLRAYGGLDDELMLEQEGTIPASQ